LSYKYIQMNELAKKDDPFFWFCVSVPAKHEADDDASE
jgi:hypothetical protein